MAVVSASVNTIDRCVPRVRHIIRIRILESYWKLAPVLCAVFREVPVLDRPDFCLSSRLAGPTFLITRIWPLSLLVNIRTYCIVLWRLICLISAPQYTVVSYGSGRLKMRSARAVPFRSGFFLWDLHGVRSNCSRDTRLLRLVQNLKEHPA